jgi:hypothetical protein
MVPGVWVVMAALLAVPAAGCRKEPAPGASASAVKVMPASSSAPQPLVAGPGTSASAEPDHTSPPSSAAPIVPKGDRDPAVELCCKMFHPYVTGCVRPGGPCPGRMGSCCDRAWKRGAAVADIEPELRRLAQLEQYFVPKPCTVSGQLPTPATSAR